MGRRSDFAHRPQDKYYTPHAAILPLLPHLTAGTVFVEPCAGDGRLVRHLESHGHVCVDAFDIAPEHDSVRQADALAVSGPAEPGVICITNPPWTRAVLHPLIDWWAAQMPTWLLFDAEWMHTRQAAPYMPLCRRIVSVGRLKWIEGSPSTGKDSCCWYLFDQHIDTPTVFHGRT